MNAPSVSPLACARAASPVIAVSAARLVQVGTRAVITVAVAAAAPTPRGVVEWQAAFSEQVELPRAGSFAAGPNFLDCAVEVPGALARRVAGSVAALQKVLGACAIVGPARVTCRRRAFVAPALHARAQRLAAASALAESTASLQLLIDAQGHPVYRFIAAREAGWERARAACPMLLPPLVYATDASRSLRQGSIAWVNTQGEFASRACRPRENVAFLELAAIKEALAYHFAHHPGRRVAFLSDSRRALGRLHTLSRYAGFFAAGLSSASWVPGHSGHLLNETADRLARQHRYQVESHLPGEWLRTIQEGIIGELALAA